MARELRAIYGAATRHEAEAALERLAHTWEAKYPTMSATWRRDWSRLTVFFDYPSEIRKVIYTTNAIECPRCLDEALEFQPRNDLGDLAKHAA